MHLCVIVKTCRLLCEPSMRHVRVASVCTGRLWGWQWIVYVDTARRRCVRAPVGASLLSTPDAEGGGPAGAMRARNVQVRCGRYVYVCSTVMRALGTSMASARRTPPPGTHLLSHFRGLCWRAQDAWLAVAAYCTGYICTSIRAVAAVTSSGCSRAPRRAGVHTHP